MQTDWRRDFGALSDEAVTRGSYIGTLIENDCYQFSLDVASTVTIGYSDITSYIELRLYEGDATNESEVAFTLGTPNADGTWSSPLPAGTYYVRAFPYEGLLTAICESLHTLSLSAEPDEPE